MAVSMSHVTHSKPATSAAKDSKSKSPNSSRKDNQKKGSGRENKDHSRSVFHVPLPAPSCSDCHECIQLIGHYVSSLQTLCGAGTHAADKMTTLLVGTPYGEIAGQFLQLQHHLESMMGETALWIQLEVERCLKRLAREESTSGKTDQDDNKCQGHSKDDVQVVAAGLVLLLQLQQQFLFGASEKLMHFSQANALGTNGLSLDGKQPQPGAVGNHSNSQSEGKSGCDQSDSRKPGHVTDMESRLHKQMMSLLSKIGQSPGESRVSSDGSKTSWYVDTSREAGTSEGGHFVAGNNVYSAGQVQVMESTCAEEQTTAPSQSDGKGPPVRPNAGVQQLVNNVGSQPQGLPVGAGNPVSEEELDVVINMLSRATKYSVQETSEPQLPKQSGVNPPGVINVPVAPPSGPISKAPGSHLTPSNNATVFSTTAPANKNPVGCYGNRAAQHRQSDGFILESSVTHENKTNTWPLKPRHKDTSATWQGSDYQQAASYFYPQGVYEPLTQQEAQYGLSPGGVKSRLMPGFNPGPWSAAPDGSNKVWPMFPNIGDSESIPRQWSAMADSSSCSDESSSNGELQWMMGMNLMENVNSKRRHSSGGEDTVLPSAGGTTNHINKSVDCLMMEPKTNTWPPKHPWVAKPGGMCDDLRGMEAPDMSMLGSAKGIPHRPLQPQWSDPLATRSLAVWDGGLTGSISQQSFISMSAGGADYSPGALPDEDKRF